MNSKSRWLRISLIHIVLWGLYVLLEYLANYFHISGGHEWPFVRATLMSLPVLMLPVYFMALFAVPRFLKKEKLFWFVACVLAAAAFVFLARMFWLEWVNYLENGRMFEIPPSKVLKNVIRDYAVIALAVSLYIIGDWRQKQAQNEALIKASAEAELQLLKGQLQPHFLFNTLNNIYSLALLGSEATADSILKLTDLLDYLVYKAGQESVLLVKEVELLKNYLELESLRYGDKLILSKDFKVENEIQKLPPLLLLPFVENCFKHGRAGKDNKFRLKIELLSTEDHLQFYVENTYRRPIETKSLKGGVGLENIKQRLELLYPGKYRLDIDDSDDIFKVALEIHFDQTSKNR
jgi:sensor histidine kinase YesM